MTSIGSSLAISLENDSEVVVSTLRNALKDTDVQEVVFHAIAFDDAVSDAFRILLESRGRSWRSIELINCRGQVDTAISLALSIDKVANLHVVRNVEIFEGFSILGAGLRRSTSLKNLRLKSTIREHDAVSLAEGVALCESLAGFDLQWCVFEDGALEAFADGLKKNRNLKFLDFFGCGLEDTKVAKIVRSLRDHMSLESLLMNGNKCSIEGIREVSKMIRKEDCRLKKLDLSFQRLDAGIVVDITSFASALEMNRSLETLDLTSNSLTDDDATALAKALSGNQTLRELFLARNKFTDAGIAAIARTLPQMKGLKKLSLWGNPFGEEAARELLNGMANNMELCDLHLFRKFKCSDEIQYFTNINRGGRKLLQASPNEVPMSLWSYVLARANTMKMPARRSLEENELGRIDMLYCLLRGPVLFTRNWC